jgi:hypothetical protein
MTLFRERLARSFGRVACKPSGKWRGVEGGVLWVRAGIAEAQGAAQSDGLAGSRASLRGLPRTFFDLIAFLVPKKSRAMGGQKLPGIYDGRAQRRSHSARRRDRKV